MSKENCVFLSKKGMCGEIVDTPCLFDLCISWKDAPLTNIVNCTPNAITFVDENGNILRTIEKSGIVVKCTQEKDHIDCIDDIPVYQRSYKKVENLPEPAKNTVYIVPMYVARAIPNRDDVFIAGDCIETNNATIGYLSMIHI